MGEELGLTFERHPFIVACVNGLQGNLAPMLKMKDGFQSTRFLSERRQAGERVTLAESLGRAKRLVAAVGADLGVVLDPAADRIFLIDDRAR